MRSLHTTAKEQTLLAMAGEIRIKIYIYIRVFIIAQTVNSPNIHQHGSDKLQSIHTIGKLLSTKKIKNKKHVTGASLVAQWERIHLPM